jgi:predicted nucleic acid-binding protein
MARSEGSAQLKVFFDSDVIIAGSFSDTGASHLLLELAEIGVIQGYISNQVVEECVRNIRRQLPVALPVFQALLDAASLRTVIPEGRFLEQARNQADEKDVPILAAALQVQADVLVTFNTRDYFPRESPPEVLNPGDLLRLIQRNL